MADEEEKKYYCPVNKNHNLPTLRDLQLHVSRCKEFNKHENKAELLKDLSKCVFTKEEMEQRMKRKRPNRPSGKIEAQTDYQNKRQAICKQEVGADRPLLSASPSSSKTVKEICYQYEIEVTGFIEGILGSKLKFYTDKNIMNKFVVQKRTLLSKIYNALGTKMPIVNNRLDTKLLKENLVCFVNLYKYKENDEDILKSK